MRQCGTVADPDSLSARYAKRPSGAFCVSGGERGVDEPSRVRQIRPERIWTAEGWPWSAQRGRVRPMDGPNNPAQTPCHSTLHRSRRFAYLAEREVWTNPPGDSAPPVPRQIGR